MIIDAELEGASHQSVARSAGDRDMESIISVSWNKDPREPLHVARAALKDVEKPISAQPRVDREVDFKVDVIQNIGISHDGVCRRDQWQLHFRQHRN